MRTITSVAAVLLALLVGAGPASADKPARGCPDEFKRFTSAEFFKKFPKAPQELFDAFDKNDDNIICGKQLRPIFNLIDNTANRP